jgi:hypothetical protein
MTSPTIPVPLVALIVAVLVGNAEAITYVQVSIAASRNPNRHIIVSLSVSKIRVM